MHIFKKVICSVIALLVCGGIIFATNSNGLTDNWNFKIPQDSSGERVKDIDLAGCEYYVLQDSQCVLVTAPTYLSGTGSAGSQDASVRTCPVEWQALLYAVHVSSALIGDNIATTRGFVVLKDTTSVSVDNTTNMVCCPIAYDLTEKDSGWIRFSPPIRISHGLSAQIDIDNIATPGIYAGVYFRRIKKN